MKQSNKDFETGMTKIFFKDLKDIDMMETIKLSLNNAKQYLKGECIPKNLSFDDYLLYYTNALNNFSEIAFVNEKIDEVIAKKYGIKGEYFFNSQKEYLLV